MWVEKVIIILKGPPDEARKGIKQLQLLHPPPYFAVENLPGYAAVIHGLSIEPNT